VALCNGDRVLLALDRAGLTITQISAGRPVILFQAGPRIVSHICASLVSSTNTSDATPLRIVVAAVVQLRSADEVRRAFNDVAARVA
jgi:hypothetical protein